MALTSGSTLIKGGHSGPAGTGVQGGVSYGSSDEWSFKVAEHQTGGYDVHATVLHLLGIDH